MTSMEPFDESVQEVVARETARRRRVFLAFLALLLVPISIGAYALSRAPKETAQIANDVAPIVTERIGSDIAARVTDDVVTRAEPLIRSNVSSEIATTVEPRISSVATALRQDLATLQTTVRETSSAVAAASTQVSAIPQLETRLASLGQSVDQTAGAFATFRTTQDGLRGDLDAQRQQFNEMRQKVDTDLGAIRALANSSVRTANANEETLGALNRHLTRIDNELKKLNTRVGAIEERLKTEPKEPRLQ